MDQSNISKCGKKLISGYSLKLEPPDFTVGLNEGCKIEELSPRFLAGATGR